MEVCFELAPPAGRGLRFIAELNLRFFLRLGVPAALEFGSGLAGDARGHLPAGLAAGPIRQLKIGSDPVGRLPAAMPSTISAADHLRRSALPSDDRRRALDLLLALAAVECHASTGGPAVVPPGLLRDLVIVTGRLAGRSWLDANADRTAAFTALQATWEPPLLAGLDQILARVLSDRFGLPSPRAAA